ncbi:TPA: arsenical pump-driving ATPase [Salmonella enterica]|jgi:arsenite-transporting ATPase|uniref:Arsenical pump-driving ATPase n=3 Tax=Pseudomonadota TaxID=1224 RepID=A0A750H8K5_SALER|nr:MULTISPECIES: arsenical pump-driving ATPase [Stenotrophomonas]EHT9986537.1 arsenical pump-driving ATPase [Salmonella enterica subsp. enterica serovar Derby]EJC1546067.1 arsenical pump-driving ATPase [Salmonella enterica subsp. enterica serovar Montevideo]EJC65672.1 arsenite transporter ATPase-like protein [Alcaligenes faecalis subsp. faecalis NCIB 8687]CEG54655.1 Arsenical pump-driving ATPase ArsA [Stutzerimonas xanthomarina]HAF6252664.1 arsenical pump-driving ATPase [Salmonella enterica]
MLFLQNPPAFLFFTGKGGVGKTSLSCATAIHLAGQGKKILLVSTDPASNVGQVFSQEIGNKITTISTVAGLSALEIDPQQAAQQYRERIVGPVRGALPDDVVKGIEEQLSGACTTEIAAFDEFTALLTDATLIADYDHIIFDTAPTGHTIRLLQLPGAWSGFIEKNPEGASCLGPLAGLEKQRQRYAEAVKALSDPERTRLILVARAQKTTLDEVARTHEELAAIGLSRQNLVINGVLPESEAVHDALAAAIHRREQEAIANMPAVLRDLPLDQLPLKAFNLVGVEALSSLFSDRDEAAPVVAGAPAKPVDLPPLSTLVDEIAETGHGLIMMMGKGGVGKTTLAAAVAVALAERGLPVHLTTSDPAAHLTDTLAGSLDNLEVSRIDPQAETERYRQHVLVTKGKDLDAEGRAMLEEDLRSPCTEEIAVFQAFSRVIREAGKKFVVMDTAPTGHTLLLLDATGAYHREVARHAESNVRYTTPMMQLQDPARTKVMIVTLAETTPVLEAANLQEDLRRAGIEPWAWLINNSLSAAPTASPLLKRRAAFELTQIEAVRTRYTKRVALVPMQAEEPIGIEPLLALVEPRNGFGLGGAKHQKVAL